MNTAIILQVDLDDVDELEGLANQLNTEVELVHPFDGAMVAQILLTISTVSLPFLRSWVKLQIEARKAVVIIHNGDELRGYTVDEVERLLKVLNVNAPPSGHA